MATSSSARRQIPIIDLGLEYEAIKKDLDPLLEKILRSGSYVLGPELALFEKELAAYIGVTHAVGVNSGTDAVLLALRTLDIKAGDEVIIKEGRFKDFCGVFVHELQDTDRVRILLNTVNFQAHVVVDRDLVQKYSTARA